MTRDGRLVIDDPEIRRRLIKTMDNYTALYRKGCTPPDAVSWDDAGNNRAFLAQTVVMTANKSLSIPNALKAERPDDYYENTATIEWPTRSDGKTACRSETSFFAAMVFKDGGHAPTAKEFVRFLVAEGWLTHYLDFSGERMLPPMPKLLDQPFWLDPSDPHRMAGGDAVPGSRRASTTMRGFGRLAARLVERDAVWAKAVHRVAADGISPEQAVDEAIARIKEILSE